MISLNALNDTFRWKTVKRLADKDVSSNNVFANDGVLEFPITASDPYIVELALIYSSPAGGGTPDIKVTFAASSGTLTGALQVFGFTTADGSGPTAMVPTGSYAAGTNAVKRTLYMFGVMNNTAAATIAVQWAQNTSNGNATRVHAGSFLRYYKVEA